MKMLVITPTLGTSPWLAETLASVAAFCPGGRHVLVAPPGVVSQLQKQFPRTWVLAEPGGGMYSAINAGLAARDDWDAFTYLNDDDLLLPGFASAIENVRKDLPQLVYGGVRLIDSTGRRLGAVPVSRFSAHNRALYAQRLEPVYQHGTVVTRPAWRQHGGFDPALRLCGDSEFLARLCVAGVPAICVPATVAAFRLHATQLTKQREAMVAERLQVDARLGLLTPPAAPGRTWARCCFRAANLAIYLERIARHGFISFDQLLARSGADRHA